MTTGGPPERSTRLVVLYTLAAFSTALTGGVWGGWGWLLLWPACCFAGLAWSYYFNRPEILGKRSDGTVQGWARFLFLPYIAYVQAVFLLKLAFLNERAWDEIVEGLFLGRLPVGGQLPRDIDLVVDLSAELREPRSAAIQGQYHYLPALNRWIPNLKGYREAVERIARMQGRTYVHCSAGKGRSALVVAGVLMQRGLVETAEEAVRFMQRHRPQVALHPAQIQLANCYRRELQSAEFDENQPQSGERRSS